MRERTPSVSCADSSPKRGSLGESVCSGGVTGRLGGCLCVMCGDSVPEGRQVCPLCEARAEDAKERGQDDGD